MNYDTKETFRKNVKEKNDIVIYLVVLVVILFGVFLFLFINGVNDRKDFTDDKTQEVIPEETKKENPMDKSINLENDNDLSSINNGASFNKTKYTEKDQLLKNESKYLLIGMESLVSSEKPTLLISSLRDEELIYYANILVAGDGEKVCYEENYLKRLVKEIFGKEVILDADATRYRYQANKICFDEVFLNAVPTSSIYGYSEDGENIEVKLMKDGKNYVFAYDKTSNALISITLNK